MKSNINIFLAVVLLVLVIVLIGIKVTDSFESAPVDVSVAEVEKLDVWEDCGTDGQADQSKCQSGLTCVLAHDDNQYRCSGLTINQGCDMNDEICKTGRCIDVQDSQVNGANVHMCSSGERYHACGTDADCIDGLTCQILDSQQQGICQRPLAERVNDDFCDVDADCASGSVCIFAIPNQIGYEGREIKRCSTLATGALCDMNDLTCKEEGATCIKSSIIQGNNNQFRCSKGELDNMCGSDADCNEGLTCVARENDWVSRCTKEETVVVDDNSTDVAKVNCGQLDVNNSKIIDLADFSNLVSKWKSECID